MWPLRLGRDRIVLILTTFLTCAVLPNVIVESSLPWGTWLLVFAGLYLAAWPVGGIVLYAVDLLAGGIMSREERRRHGA